MPPARKTAGSTPTKASAADKAPGSSGTSSTGSGSSKTPVQKNRLDNYFSKAGSASASTSSSGAAQKAAPAAHSSKPKATPPRRPSAASAAVTKKASSKKEEKNDDDFEVIEIDDDDDDAPISKPASSSRATSSSSKKRVLDDDEDDFEMDVKPKAKVQKKSPAKAKAPVVNEEDDDFEMEVKPKAKAQKKSPVKAKAPVDDEEDDDLEMDVKPKAKAQKQSPVKAKAPVKKETSSKAAVSASMSAPAEEDVKPKPKWPFTGARAGPSNPGGKPIPEGKPNCLNGLTFVFTGELETLDREQALELVRRYGARVTSSPSSKTSYVVLGTDPGPSKLKMIKDKKLATLDEDGLFELIASRGAAPLTVDQKKKLREEEDKVKQAAKKLDQETAKIDPAALWTVKYAPRSVKDIVANKTNVEKLQKWLNSWSANLKCGFKKPGKDAMGTFRAVLISGPPGIGKTTTAHLVAKLEGFDPIELNASDARSKKLVEMSLKDTLDNANLDSFLKGKPMNESMTGGIRITPKTCLIMDEVDGMSGGDRGGVGAINALIKKTKVPIICICNDRRNKKMQPFERTCFSMPFRKPETKMILSRMMTIAFKEGIKIPGEVMNQLIESAEGDLRLVINMLSTWKLSSNTMNFDEAKAFGAANAKPGIHTPFTLYSELAGPYMFSQTSRKTLNDKADFYFQDFSLMPLMVQENYAKQKPVLANKESTPRLKDYEAMRLMAKASLSISDGDVLDGMIRGGDQHWSLMPHHAIASCVRPCSYVYGQHSNHFPSFPSWLGQNSKNTRLRRNLIDLQARMRLATLGGCSTKQELRQDYQPVLWHRLTKPMVDDQTEGIDEVVTMMDDYYLGIEDRDAILELGVGGNDFEAVAKKIPAATKAAFTRKYNAASHPMAFVKAFDISKAKPLKGAEMPDVEEAFEEELSDADDAAEADAGDSDIEIDISKSKGIKKAKAKPIKGKGKAKK
ncbi:DNA replication factor C complex subunit Rfc1 [Tilletia horrida]|uniref:Replication factor C subunit 1 n=1 Tax=Tilletia horrida TaxID=155126 RepID=A0AAN6GEC5_9BASI|nr:DNA replication factor C complex subunit Rfc1 [Tilletia horrida]KAK0558956.1 DNA replication factor C complex subunit Rfc1 [Tilletia horrida]